jgi:DNA-directed RNA polymerase specialized sigma24 family protein
MPEAGTTFASFAATHEDRLVRSVMSEIGLSHAEAAAVAREVLPAAFQRTFATCGAAYGWLRVAARHRAAGSDRWAAAADAALGHADSALVVLAGLSHEDRELLRLRYVDGLLPAALAERTGRTLAEVQDGLDRASAAARAVTCEPEADLAQRIPAPRMPARGSLPRFAAAAALAALALLSAGVTPSSPPLAGEPFRPAFDPMTPVTTTAADAPEAVTARPAYRTVAGPAATSPTPARSRRAGAAPEAAATSPTSCTWACRRRSATRPASARSSSRTSPARSSTSATRSPRCPARSRAASAARPDVVADERVVPDVPEHQDAAWRRAAAHRRRGHRRRVAVRP